MDAGAEHTEYYARYRALHKEDLRAAYPELSDQELERMVDDDTCVEQFKDEDFEDDRDDPGNRLDLKQA